MHRVKQKKKSSNIEKIVDLIVQNEFTIEHSVNEEEKQRAEKSIEELIKKISITQNSADSFLEYMMKIDDAVQKRLQEKDENIF